MPISLTFDSSSFEGKVSAYHGYPDRQEEIIAEAFERLSIDLVPLLAENTPYVSGDLARSTRGVITILSPDIILDIIQPATNILGDPYQDAVARGRSSGRRPPPLALEHWVEVRWGVPADKVKAAAFRLSKYIGDFGTEEDTYIVEVLFEAVNLIAEVSEDLGIRLAASVWSADSI